MTVIEAHFVDRIISPHELEHLKQSTVEGLVKESVMRKLELAIAINSSYTSRLLVSLCRSRLYGQINNDSQTHIEKSMEKNLPFR